MTERISKDMIIADMLKVDAGIAAILMASGCPSAQGESLEEAAMVHGLNADELVANVNDYLSKK